MIQFIFSFFLLLNRVEAQAPAHHYDLELSSRELELILEDRKIQNGQVGNQVESIQLMDAASADLDPIISMGKRNLAWLNHMNSRRKDPIKFTQPGSLKSIPITNPKKYSDVTVIDDYQKLVPTLLPEMKSVLIDGMPFTDEPPADLENYIVLGRKVDRIYQTALRWQLMLPYLGWYEQKRIQDIRGYYFLSRDNDLEKKITHFNDNTDEVKKQLEEWLEQLCYNSQENSRFCQEKFLAAKGANDLITYYKTYFEGGKRIYDNFFQLQNPRPDLKWTDISAAIPIRNPTKANYKEFLKSNIEDEYRWENWRLNIDFSSTADVRVILVAGVTPHVNGLGGNKIYMDDSVPLTEWDNQWTIRHEFGHVLGLPDCYVEFYEPNEKLMISYQIDVDDLMCSRAGKMNERIYKALKSSYQTTGAP